MVGMLKGMIQGAATNPMQVYMDWGKYDMRNPHENWDLSDAGRDFAQTIEGKGHKFTGGQCHDGTDWPSWRNRYDKMFGTLFPLKS